MIDTFKFFSKEKNSFIKKIFLKKLKLIFNLNLNFNKTSAEQISNFCFFFSNFHDSVWLNRTRVKSLFCIESIESNALFGQIVGSIRLDRIMKI